MQRFILKLHSSKIREAKWNLTLKLSDARRNNELVSLAGSQVLRWIDELNGNTNWEIEALSIRSEIRQLGKQPGTIQNKRQIKKLYDELDTIQFKPDYISIVIDRVSDYRRLCKGFKINGIEYKRLLGTAGGIKMSTIVFVSARLHDEIARRIDNGRDMSKMFNPAKLEAYRALSCSASHPVSMPDGIAVVHDCETEFMADVIHLKNAEGDGEPIMSDKAAEVIKLDSSDGFGLMLPSLAKRWSDELGLDYMMSGCNTRMSYLKGMLFTFDFLDFAENVAGRYIIKDVWGNDVDVRNVEAIFTESMLKLWDSYNCCEDYIHNSIKNNYSFSITKTAPQELDNERCMNYQFIQSFDLNHDEIGELVKTSMDEIVDVLGYDYRKTLLFLNGTGMNERSVKSIGNNYIKAMMIWPEIINDPKVQDSVYRQIKNRIKEAKTGVIKVHGNFSIASGDPYALCQNMFDMEVTGLLKSGEIYNKYWSDNHADEVTCYRAPMSCHNNIRKLHPVNKDDANYWYRYITTCTIFNAWDTCMPALNGMDFDGDLVFLTDNSILLKKHRELPALMCEQSSAKKIIPTEDDFINSNIAGFGNDIGKITNRITSMYDIQSAYDKESEEYRTLAYRISAGQLQQQDCIDKIKGIVSKPMPKSWYDRHAIDDVDDSKKELYNKIVADRKPYFMRYIYPSISKEYNTYCKKANRNALKNFGRTLDELINDDNVSESEFDFLSTYKEYLPLGNGDCVMNNICWMFENRFDSVKMRRIEESFDYTVMKSDTPYKPSEYKAIQKLYSEYNARLKNFTVFQKYEKEDEYEFVAKLTLLNDEFIRKCTEICPNEKSRCDLILDMTYKSNLSKSFAWEICGSTIIENLMDKFGRKLSFPVKDDNGDICFCGNKFRMITVELEDTD